MAKGARASEMGQIIPSASLPDGKASPSSGEWAAALHLEMLKLNIFVLGS